MLATSTLRAWRVYLLLSALDCLLAGLWLAFFPKDLFALLQIAGTSDILMWRALGILLAAQSLFVLAAAQAPRLASLLLVPILGRSLLVGIWVWLIFSPPVRLAPGPASILILHDAFWLPGWLAFLASQRSPPARP